ncbi:uncharacterized protein BDV14DRAFT_200109 [Aspergillus stella-maris]|uniref:uncharacterized protein n=1 Tax=Aspergillus stella-maris TaxID=1810926 RepID=UPI003CCCE6B3
MSHNIAAPPPGIYTPFPPFYHDEQSHSIDLTKLLRHVSRLAKAGITGLLINSPSVFPRHTAHAEGVSLIRSIRAHISGLGYGKFTIIASIPAANVRRALEEIDGVKGAGADYALVIPPVQGKGNRSFNGPAVMGFVYDVSVDCSAVFIASDLDV